MHNACALVDFPMVTAFGTLTQAECGEIFSSAKKGAPKGKEDLTAVLLFVMGSLILRMHGACWVMIMVSAWYVLLFVKFEHRYPTHLAFATLSFCMFLVEGKPISGFIRFGHDDALLPTGRLGILVADGVFPIFCLWGAMLPCHLFAFAACKGAAKSKTA